MASLNEAIRLFNKAVAMPHSEKKAEVFEQAAEMALAHGDRSLAFLYRLNSVQTYAAIGLDRPAFLGYGWLHAEYSERAEEYQQHEWMYIWTVKMIAANIAYMIELPLEKAYEVLENFRQVLKEQGYSEGTYFQKKSDFMNCIGEHEKSLEYALKAQEMTMDDMGDPDFTQRNIVRQLLLVGRDDEFIQRAEQLLNTPGVHPYVELAILSHVAMYHYVHDDLTKAKEYINGALEIANKQFDEPMPYEGARYIVIMARAGKYDAALQKIKDSTDDILRKYDPIVKFFYLQGCRTALMEIPKEQLEKAVLPNAFSDWLIESKLPRAQLPDILRGKLEDIATLVDKRNGNTYYTRIIDDFFGMEDRLTYRKK